MHFVDNQVCDLWYFPCLISPGEAGYKARSGEGGKLAYVCGLCEGIGEPEGDDVCGGRTWRCLEKLIAVEIGTRLTEVSIRYDWDGDLSLPEVVL